MSQVNSLTIIHPKNTQCISLSYKDSLWYLWYTSELISFLLFAIVCYFVIEVVLFYNYHQMEIWSYLFRSTHYLNLNIWLFIYMPFVLYTLLSWYFDLLLNSIINFLYDDIYNGAFFYHQDPNTLHLFFMLHIIFNNYPIWSYFCN